MDLQVVCWAILMLCFLVFFFSCLLIQKGQESGCLGGAAGQCDEGS